MEGAAVVAERGERFSTALRQLRESRDMGRADLARRTGLAYETIRRYEEEERRPSYEAVFRIAGVFGLHTLIPLLRAAGYSIADVPDTNEWSDLTLAEADLLNLFRSMTEEGRGLFREFGLVLKVRQFPQQQGHDENHESDSTSSPQEDTE